MRRMNYGELPSEAEFYEAFDTKLGDRSYVFGNDKRMGSGEATMQEIWREMLVCVDEGSDEALNWVSCILYNVGIDWV